MAVVFEVVGAPLRMEPHVQMEKEELLRFSTATGIPIFRLHARQQKACNFLVEDLKEPFIEYFARLDGLWLVAYEEVAEEKAAPKQAAIVEEE